MFCRDAESSERSVHGNERAVRLGVRTARAGGRSTEEPVRRPPSGGAAGRRGGGSVVAAVWGSAGHRVAALGENRVTVGDKAAAVPRARLRRSAFRKLMIG